MRLLHVRLRAGRRRERAWTATLWRRLITALHVWMLAIRLLMLRRIFHHYGGHGQLSV